MNTLMCNVLLTRRQEMCFILSETGELLWSGRQVHAAITWLMEQEHDVFTIVDSEDENPLEMTARRV